MKRELLEAVFAADEVISSVLSSFGIFARHLPAELRVWINAEIEKMESKKYMLDKILILSDEIVLLVEDNSGYRTSLRFKYKEIP